MTRIFCFFLKVVALRELPRSRTARLYYNLLYERAEAFMPVRSFGSRGTVQAVQKVYCEGKAFFSREEQR